MCLHVEQYHRKRFQTLPEAAALFKAAMEHLREQFDDDPLLMERIAKLETSWNVCMAAVFRLRSSAKIFLANDAAANKDVLGSQFFEGQLQRERYTLEHFMLDVKAVGEC